MNWRRQERKVLKAQEERRKERVQVITILKRLLLVTKRISRRIEKQGF